MNPIQTSQLEPVIPLNLTNASPDTTAVDYLNSYSLEDYGANAKLNADKSSMDYAKAIGAVFGEEAKLGQYEQQLGKDELDKRIQDYDKEIYGITRNFRAYEDSLNKGGQGFTQSMIERQLSPMRTRVAQDVADLEFAKGMAEGSVERMQKAAKDKVALETAPLKAEVEMKKLLLENNLDRFNEAEKLQIENNIKKEERAYDEIVAEKESIQNLKIEVAKNGLKDMSIFDGVETFDEALDKAGPFMAVADNDVVKLDNGNTVIVDKRTGRVINNLGGGKAPTVIDRKVNGVSVSGYTMVAGDDPYVIAQINGIDVPTLKKLNPQIKDWNNIQPGAVVNVPLPEKDAFIRKLQGTEGGKNLTDTSIQKLDKGLTVLNQLDVLQKNIKGVSTGPIAGKFKGANPWDTNAQVIKTSLNAIVPNLARGVYGEVGVLTDNDIKTYSKTIPNLESTEAVRNAILYITLDMIGKSIKNTLDVNASAGRDVSGFIDIYTEMENSKNSILSQIPGSQVPQAFQGSSDDFLNSFNPQNINSAISNSDFFNNLY